MTAQQDRRQALYDAYCAVPAHQRAEIRCPFCNFGSCSATRPESPVTDAGVDAPGPGN